MTLDRTPFRRLGNGNGYTLGFLRALGVPQKLLYVGRGGKGVNGSFWTRQINHLEVLEIASSLYRHHVARIHPDRPGGSHEDCARLNSGWQNVRRRFKERGFELV